MIITVQDNQVEVHEWYIRIDPAHRYIQAVLFPIERVDHADKFFDEMERYAGLESRISNFYEFTPYIEFLAIDKVNLREYIYSYEGIVNEDSAGFLEDLPLEILEKCKIFLLNKMNYFEAIESKQGE